MIPELFGHPFSSYTWKALIALYESGTPFTFRALGPEHADNGAALSAVWPTGKFPVLVDGELVLPEAGIIAEHAAPGLVPADRGEAREVRLLDRVFDLHVQSPFQAIVSEHLPFLHPVPDAGRIERARRALDAIYGWLDARIADRAWAAGAQFSLADCAGGPAIFYTDWVHPIPERFAALRGYRARVLARPSVARCVEEARPYRHLFPLGAPDRD
jgi:glutathione S-transferase